MKIFSASIDKMLAEIDERFTTTQKNVTAMETGLNNGRAELNRLQGEYRALVKLRDEAKVEEGKVKEIPLTKKGDKI